MKEPVRPKARRSAGHAPARGRYRPPLPPILADGASATPATRPPAPDLRYWRQRLVHRTYGAAAGLVSLNEFSVQIEHEGRSYFFPLGTESEQAAALRAREIHQLAQQTGWPAVLEAFPREFTLAIFWGENPMVFTYTTLYTIAEGGVPPPPAAGTPRASRQVSVAIVEPDAGCRRALAQWMRALPDYTCAGLFANSGEALDALGRAAFELILINRQPPDSRAEELARGLRQRRPRTPTLGYRVYNNSDELFVSQPRVSDGYFFRRRLPRDLLEPIAGAWQEDAPTAAQWQARIDRYFQRLLHSASAPTDGSDALALTSREHEILGCLCRGIPDKKIASALDISPWTVHTHLKRVYEKLQVHSRAEAILKVLHG